MDDADLVATRPGATPAGATAFVPHERYVLIEQLGEGGMGTVWAAHDKVLDRTVALKVLHDRFLGAEDQARLAAEARVMARLSHRNVVAVYDVAQRDGRTYLIMELVRGIHLGQWLAQPRTWQEVLAVARAAARGLEAAHAAGVIHRDIKPSNILVGTDGEVRVADFGVAAPPNDAPGGLIGTLMYMSPAQLRSEPADARGDQFAFFVSLYEALHGQRPFEGTTVTELCEAIERGSPPPIKDVPRWLHAAVARGLSADPAARFPSIGAANAALAGPRRRRWLGGSAVVLGAVGFAIYAGTRATGAAACPDPARELAGVWDDAARTRGREAFQQGGLAYAPAAWDGVAKELDRRATEWTASATRACRDDDRPRRACLADQLALLRALAARLGTADRAVVDRSVSMFLELPPISDCASPASLPAVSLTARSEDLAVARADVVASPSDAGLAAAARARAAAAGDRALELAARLTHARGLLALGRTTEAIPELAEIRTSAMALGARAVALDAMLDLFRTQPDVDPKPALELAVQLDDPRRHALALALVAELATRRGDRVIARARLIEAEAVARIAHLDDAVWMAPIYEALARAQLRAGATGEALAVVKQLLDRTRMFGELHPAHGRALLIAGEVNLVMGRRDKALAKTTQALRIAQAAFGEYSLEAAQAQHLYGRISNAVHDDTMAERSFRTAYAIRMRLAPTTDAAHESRTELAAVLQRIGRGDEAAALP